MRTAPSQEGAFALLMLKERWHREQRAKSGSVGDGFGELLDDPDTT